MIFFIESTENKAEAKAKVLRQSGYEVQIIFIPSHRRKHMKPVEGEGTWQVRTLPKNHFSFKVKKKETEEPTVEEIAELDIKEQ